MNNVSNANIELRENDRREISAQINAYLKKGGKIESIQTAYIDPKIVRKASGVARVRSFED